MLKRFFLNLKELSDASVASLTKQEYGPIVRTFFANINEIFSVNV